MFNVRWNCREETNIDLLPMGHYATGICFVDQATHLESEALFEEIAKDCSLKVKISSPKAATLQVTESCSLS